MLPEVPYASFEEYEALQLQLINSYQDMVQKGVEEAQIDSLCYCEGLSWGVKGYWLVHGVDLFLRLTKGVDRDWCTTTNTLVVHALDTAVRVLVRTHARLGRPLTSTDRQLIGALLRMETMLAIAEWECDPNNMTEFEDHNFEYLDMPNEDGNFMARRLPIGSVRDLKLAFAMLSHPRLGASGHHALNSDLIRLILSPPPTGGIFD